MTMSFLQRDPHFDFDLEVPVEVAELATEMACDATVNLASNMAPEVSTSGESAMAPEVLYCEESETALKATMNVAPEMEPVAAYNEASMATEAQCKEATGMEPKVSLNEAWDMADPTRLTRSEENQKWRRRVTILEGKVDCLERSLDAVFAQLRSEEAPTREVITASEYTRMVYEVFAKNNSELGISKLLIRKFLHTFFGIDHISKYQRRRLSNFLKKEVDCGRLFSEGELYRLA